MLTLLTAALGGPTCAPGARLLDGRCSIATRPWSVQGIFVGVEELSDGQLLVTSVDDGVLCQDLLDPTRGSTRPIVPPTGFAGAIGEYAFVADDDGPKALMRLEGEHWQWHADLPEVTEASAASFDGALVVVAAEGAWLLEGSRWKGIERPPVEGRVASFASRVFCTSNGARCVRWKGDWVEAPGLIDAASLGAEQGHLAWPEAVDPLPEGSWELEQDRFGPYARELRGGDGGPRLVRWMDGAWKEVARGYFDLALGPDVWVDLGRQRVQRPTGIEGFTASATATRGTTIYGLGTPSWRLGSDGSYQALPDHDALTSGLVALDGDVLLAFHYDGTTAWLQLDDWSAGPTFALSEAQQRDIVGKPVAMAGFGNHVLAFRGTEGYRLTPGSTVLEPLGEAPMPVMSLLRVGERLFAIGRPLGGRQMGAWFDPEKGWSEPEHLPFNVYWPALAALPYGRVLVLGGAEDASSGLGSERTWLHQTGGWVEGPELPMRVHDGPVATLPDGRLVVSGYQGEMASWKPGDDAWHREPPGPDDISALAPTDDGRLVIVSAGFGRNGLWIRDEPVTVGFPELPPAEDAYRRALCLARPGCVPTEPASAAR